MTNQHDNKTTLKNKKTAGFVRRLTGAWFPIEKETRTEKVHVRMPLPLVMCLLTIGLSLLMIVGSSALLSNTYREAMALQSELDFLTAEQKDLNLDLNDRIDLLAIRNIAVNEYGMINEEYVSARYLNVRGANGLESYRAEDEHVTANTAR